MVDITDHSTVSLDRPVVDGKPRYQVQCACGRRTDIGPRRLVEREQKDHRGAIIEERRAQRRSEVH